MDLVLRKMLSFPFPMIYLSLLRKPPSQPYSIFFISRWNGYVAVRFVVGFQHSVFCIP